MAARHMAIRVLELIGNQALVGRRRHQSGKPLLAVHLSLAVLQQELLECQRDLRRGLRRDPHDEPLSLDRIVGQGQHLQQTHVHFQHAGMQGQIRGPKTRCTHLLDRLVARQLRADPQPQSGITEQPLDRHA